MKKKNNEAKIEKYTDSKGNTIFAVKILNLDTLNWLTMLRTKSLDVAEAWAYTIASSVSYNID